MIVKLFVQLTQDQIDRIVAIYSGSDDRSEPACKGTEERACCESWLATQLEFVLDTQLVA